MAAPDPVATLAPGDATATTAGHQPPGSVPSHSAPFQQQLEYLHTQHRGPSHVGQYGHFDLAAMAAALPQAGQSPMSAQSFSGPSPSQGMSSPNPYQSSQMLSYPRGPPQFADPTMLVRAQHQQFFSQQYGGPSPIQRQQGFPIQPQLQFSPVDPYGFSMSPGHFTPSDPRFGSQPYAMMPAMPVDMGQFSQRGATDTAPIPSFPRGPPRKPKQSGHALWVGNLPPAAKVTDLKDHFSRDATTDIESVFLIAKSNCAFVNYGTEAACVAAMNRFHDSRFHGVRLVCRLRRGNGSSSVSTPIEEPSAPSSSERSSVPHIDGVDGTDGVDGVEEEPTGPTIACSRSGQSGTPDHSHSGDNGTSPLATGEKVPEKYFIVKSLTAQDLEASVRNGIWATQSHNEEVLNRAYNQAENVFLVFSANKSGEYFGYARMASAISGEPIDLSTIASGAAEEVSTDSAGSPQSIPTPATATAPKGRIIDDSARGTIFWEADHSEDDESLPAKDGSGTGQNWGRQFPIEWLSTNRLPFYRTRGLRNPWNANREVKIARDGTELEPTVGRRLVQMFLRPSPSPSVTQVPAPYWP